MAGRITVAFNPSNVSGGPAYTANDTGSGYTNVVNVGYGAAGSTETQVDATHGLPVRVTDNSSHFLPAGDAVTRSVFVAPGDATNQFLSGTATNLAAATGATNAMLTVHPGHWAVTNTGAAAAQATVAQSAGGAGVKLVLDSVTVSLAAGAAAQTPLTASVIQDAGGTPVTLWTASLSAPANSSAVASATGLGIISTVANKTLTVQFSGTGTANTIQSVSMSGYSCV